MKPKEDILNFTQEELIQAVTLIGEKPFRGKQLFKWLYRGVSDFDQMTDLSKDFSLRLKENYLIGNLVETARKESSDKQTIKYLFLLADNNIIECVAMEYHHGITLCLSTQIGCRMGCTFCASTHGGRVRNLLPGEMTAQILAVNNDLIKTNKRPISSLVLMGSGEPLDNYDNTIKFLKLIHEPDGLNFGYRSITLSTCGLVPKIRTLATEGMPINLAISLHAPSQVIREKLMPGAAVYPILDVIDAARYYFEQTGRRVTFEYALIKGVNDQREHGIELAKILEGFPCHVNIIPLNEVLGTGLLRSSEDDIVKFMETLTRGGVHSTRRRELGLDIEGACGQLRASYYNKDDKQGG